MTRSRIVATLAALVLLAALGPMAPAGDAEEATYRAARISDGGDVFAFGSAPFRGSLADTAIEEPIRDIIATPSGNGYWLAAGDGGVFSFGDAKFRGSAGGIRLNQPIVGMARTPSGLGYWLVARDGGIFSYGDAKFRGSTGGIRLNQPIVGIARTPSGQGYWLVASDGGVFSFGDARFRGSTGSIRLNQPIVGMARSDSGRGYWLVASDGGIFAFGDAKFHGSTGGMAIGQRIVDMATANRGRGYWLAGDGGGVYTFGVAKFHGALSATPEEPIVGISGAPGSGGYWLASSPAPAPPFAGPPLPPNSGTGRRVVYSNSQQRLWLVASAGYVEDSWPVSGRRGIPDPGNYGVFSRSRWTRSGNGSVSMEFMVRFAHGSSLAIGFHSIPVDSSGRPIQSESELGQYRSAGCVRQRRSDAMKLWDWAPIGTPVVVTP